LIITQASHQNFGELVGLRSASLKLKRRKPQFSCGDLKSGKKPKMFEPGIFYQVTDMLGEYVQNQLWKRTIEEAEEWVSLNGTPDAIIHELSYNPETGEVKYIREIDPPHAPIQ
jgi:hypothetical protein